MEITYEERKGILLKPYLSCADIMRLEEVKEKTAQAIMHRCKIIYGGTVPMNSHKIKTDSYLQYTGQEKGTWLKLISALEGHSNA